MGDGLIIVMHFLQFLQTGLFFIVGFILGYVVRLLRESKQVLEECKAMLLKKK